VSETYWRCQGCGEWFGDDPGMDHCRSEADSNGDEIPVQCGPIDCLELHPLGTAAELAELRAIKVQLEDNAMVYQLHPIHEGVVLEALGAYRRAVLGKE
jgi:hypothetical protein